MKKRYAFIALSLLFCLLAGVSFGQTVSQFKYGISTPYIYTYDTTTGWRGTYYLALPTLTGNDTLCGLGTAQSFTARKAIASGASLDVESGGDLDIESGGYFKIAGTAVTSTAAELNALAGTGLSAAELGFLNGATAGTQVASKAVIADAYVNIGIVKATQLHIGTSGSETQVTATGAQLNFLSGVTAGTSASSKAVVLSAAGKIDTIDMTAWKINGTSVNATAAQLDFLYNVTAGTAAASKAVVLDASSQIDVLDVKTTFKKNNVTVTPTAAEFNVLSGVTPGTAKASAAVVLDASSQVDALDIKTTFKLNNVTVTATAANLNAIPTATGTGTEIDEMTKDVCSSASTFTLDGAGTVTETVTIQLKDVDGNNISAVQHLFVYISDDSAGGTPATSAANGAVSWTTGGTIKEVATKLCWHVVTNASGAAVLSIDNSGGSTYTKYVAVVLPNSKIKISAALNVTGS